MADNDIKGKKRKGAQESAPKAKKSKKSEGLAPPTEPANDVKTAPKSAESKPVKSKSVRKQAADFMDVDEAPAPEPSKLKAAKDKRGKAAAVEPDVLEAQEKPKRKAKKSKVADTVEAPVPEATEETAKPARKGKKAVVAPIEEDTTAGAEEVAASAKPKKARKTNKKQEKSQEELSESATVPPQVEEATEEDVDVDDQTAALLAGFESDGDSEDPEDDLNFEDDVHVPTLTKQQRKSIDKADKTPKSNEPGVVYVGRIPRGFFEPQMKKYFSQFGRVNRLRLSRNKRTGASKHYAFVEFASTEVADIVARTMDNYLLFGHILQCKLIAPEQVHPDLFKGAGQRFKVDPRNKKAGLEMERGVPRAQWEKRVEKEKKRRIGRAKEIKEIFGYEYNAPELKSVDSVPFNVSAPALETEESQKVLTNAAPTKETAPVDEQPNTKKGKKAVKSKVEVVATPAIETQEPQPLLTETPTEEAAAVSEKPKAKKGKKAAKPQDESETTEAIQPAPEKKAKKSTKANTKATKKTNDEVETIPETIVVADPEPIPEAAADPAKPAATTKKSKKDKKRKSDVALEVTAITEGTVLAEVAPNSKKSKKEPKADATAVEDVKEKKRRASKAEQDTVAKPKKAKKAEA